MKRCKWSIRETLRRTWLSSFLNVEVRLVCLAAGQDRYTQKEFADGFSTGLTDGFPFHVFAQASLDAVNSKLKTSLPTKRFRPNIVADEAKPFAEDTWKVWRVGGRGGVVFENCKPCSRCSVPTVDNGKFGDAEITVVLNKKRKGRQLGVGPWGQGQVFFGQNAICLTVPQCGVGKIKVGDVIEVLQFESKEKIVGARQDLTADDLKASAM